MSHHRTPTGRLYVECDSVNSDTLTRCARRTFGRGDLSTDVARVELGLFDLPGGWAVAPYPDGYRHDVRRLYSDPHRGEVISDHPLAGMLGDLHTCPSCDRAMARA